MVFERKERIPRSEVQTNASPSTVFERKERISRNEVQTNAPPSLERKERILRNEVQTNASLTLVSERKERISRNGVQTNASLAMVSERKERIPRNEDRNDFPSIPNTPSDIDESPSPNIPVNFYLNFHCSLYVLVKNLYTICRSKFIASSLQLCN